MKRVSALLLVFILLLLLTACGTEPSAPSGESSGPESESSVSEPESSASEPEPSTSEQEPSEATGGISLVTDQHLPPKAAKLYELTGTTATIYDKTSVFPDEETRYTDPLEWAGFAILEQNFDANGVGGSWHPAYFYTAYQIVNGEPYDDGVNPDWESGTWVDAATVEETLAAVFGWQPDFLHTFAMENYDSEGGRYWIPLGGGGPVENIVLGTAASGDIVQLYVAVLGMHPSLHAEAACVTLLTVRVDGDRFTYVSNEVGVVPAMLEDAGVKILGAPADGDTAASGTPRADAGDSFVALTVNADGDAALAVTVDGQSARFVTVPDVLAVLNPGDGTLVAVTNGNGVWVYDYAADAWTQVKTIPAADGATHRLLGVAHDPETGAFALLHADESGARYVSFFGSDWTHITTRAEDADGADDPFTPSFAE